MKYAFFQVPAADGTAAAGELNSFLTGHRIIGIQKELVRQECAVYWAFCVEYFDAGEQGKGPFKNKVDYREILSEADFAVFSRLRDIRKRIAEEKGIPVYTIFTNQQLAAMATGKPQTLTALEKIDGIGKGKTEQYGENFLSVLKEHTGETSGEPVS